MPGAAGTGRAPADSPAWLRASALAYAVILSALSIAKHEAFNSTAKDLGIYDQVMWRYSHFLAPYSSILGINHLGDHFSPILIPLAPLYWIWPGVHALLVLQSVAVALAVFPLYRLSILVLPSETWAKVATASFLLNGYLLRIALFDFHPIVFELFFVLTMIASVETRRPWSYWIVLPLLLMTEDDAFISALTVGLYAFLRRDRRTAAITWAIALAYGVTVLQVVQPWINRGHPNPHIDRYAFLGGSFLGIIGHIVRHPVDSLAPLVTLPRIGALLGFLGMTAFLSLLGGWTALLLVPPLAVEFLSSYPQQYLLRNQYAVPALSFLYLATLRGITRVGDRRVARSLQALLILIPLTQIPTLAHQRLSAWPWSAHAVAGRRFLPRVPREASLATQSVLVPHLSQRDVILILPELDRVEYVLVDTEGNPFPMSARDMAALVDALPNDFDVVSKEDGYILWRRKSAGLARGGRVGDGGGT